MSMPPSSVLERIDQICDRYEAARLAGQRPRIADYLREVPEAERTGLLHELLRLERAYLQNDQRQRWQRGERITVQAYLEEAASLRDYPDLVFELVCGEVLLREELGEKPRPVDYLELVPTHQVQLRHFFAARRLLPPETLPEMSDQLTLRAAKLATVVEAGHTVDELPPRAYAPAPAPQAPERPTARSETAVAPPGYEIYGELGRGGMGVVYQARQVNADRLVALKMILAVGHAEPDQLARFRTEAEAIARLQHPHVVQVFEVGEYNNLPFFSLEFCTGGSLDKKLAGTPLPPVEAAVLVEKLARGVQAAHEAKVLHRDLKPANVLLTADGTPKVTDFGLAKKLDAQGVTLLGVIMGTPSYMAPEQASGAGAKLGPAVDVYALGAILYECLTGRPPFRAATTWDTLQQVLTREPVQPRQLNAQVPRDLETVCLKCLQKESAKRYGSAAALADELGRFLRGEPILARPVGRLERGVKWARREPRVAILLMAVFASLLLGTTVAMLFAIRAENKAENARNEALRADHETEEAKKSAQQEQLARTRAEFQALRAGNALHVNQLDQAFRAWQQNDIVEVERILGEVDPQFRDTWETRHLLEIRRHKALPLLDPKRRSSPWTHSPVNYVVGISGDGKRIVANNCYDEAVLWDAESGRVIWSYRPDQPLPSGGGFSKVTVAISNDGKRIVSGTVEEIRVWDTESGRVIRTIKGNMGKQKPPSVAISGDGKRIVAGSDNLSIDPAIGPGKVRVWDAESGKEICTLGEHIVDIINTISVAISHDGKRIVSNNRGTVRVWDAESGKEICTLKKDDPTGEVSSVTISGDGKRIILAGYNGTVRVLDAERGREIRTLKAPPSENCVAFSGDGKRIVRGDMNGIIRVWDAESGLEEFTLKGVSGVATVAVSKDGKRIVAGGRFKPSVGSEPSAEKKRTWSLMVWNPESSQEKLNLKGHTWKNPGEAMGLSVAVSHDSKRVASQSWRWSNTVNDRKSTVKVWDAESGREIPALVEDGMGRLGGLTHISAISMGWLEINDAASSGLTNRAEFSGDGKRIVSINGGTIRIWDVESDREIGTLELSREMWHGISVAISYDGKRLVVGCRDGTVKVWDVESFPVKELCSFKGHTPSQDRIKMPFVVSSVAISGDGTRIISGGDDGTVRVWDAETGVEKLTLKGHTGAVTCVAISSDGKRIISGGIDGTIRVWDALSD